jgi:hypothetical protein
MYIQTVQGRIQDDILWYLSLHFSRRGFSPSTTTLNFLLERKNLISLIKLAEKCSFYSKPGWYVVSEALSISKNTAAVDVLLLKFRVTWFVKLMH